MLKKIKLAILVSHPIQYQVPLYKLLAKEESLDLTVLYCSDWGAKIYYDEQFGKNIKWDTPLLDGYKYKVLKNISPFPEPSKYFGLINPQIVDELKNGNYDAIWIHGWNSVTNMLAIMQASNLDIPILIRGDSSIFNEPRFLKKILKKLILKPLFKKVSGFLTIGFCNKEFYESYSVPEEKIFFVPYSIDNDFFISKAKELSSKKAHLKCKYGIPEHCIVILFSGKFIRQKNPVELLKAYELIAKEADVALVFAGDGFLKKALETYIKENNIKNVYFTGFKNQSELPELYALADIFALTSIFDQWGLVINEAMCFSLPVIASNKVGASQDIVKEGINGYIYNSLNVDELVDKLNILVQDKVLREKFGRASFEIISMYSYKEAISGIMDCLEKVMLKNT